MNIFQKDLNMLLIFKVVMEELNASRAAERLSMSQPALSHALNKLRRDFDDPLFVRKSRGLTPTPTALALVTDVNALIEGMEGLYQRAEAGDFMSRPRDVVIYATDYMQAVLLPGLLDLLADAAPNTRLIFLDPQGKLPRKALESGECDIAIAGYFEQLPSTYYQQQIAVESFVTLACRQCSGTDAELTLADFLSRPHVVTTLTGDLNGVVDQALARLDHSRKIVAGISSFVAAADLIVDSDRLLTCLGSLGQRAERLYPQLCQYACPLALPAIEVYQIWHQRTHHDPFRVWLRRQIFQLMANHR